LFLLCLVATGQSNPLTKYKAVEAYEIRPGIIAFPKYAGDGQVCEVGFEKRLYSPEKVTLDFAMSRGEIDAVVDELAPASQRGIRSRRSIKGLNTITGIGHAMREIEDYENVTVRLETTFARSAENEATVVIVAWKARVCK
jgi:hypothetical protein